MNRVVIALAALLLHAADVCAYVPSTAAASRRVHTALAASSSPTTSRRNALTSSGAALGLLLVSPSAARAEKTPSGTRYELAAEPGQEVTTCASRDPKPRRLQTITRVVVRPPPGTGGTLPRLAHTRGAHEGHAPVRGHVHHRQAWRRRARRGASAGVCCEHAFYFGVVADWAGLAEDTCRAPPPASVSLCTVELGSPCWLGGV